MNVTDQIEQNAEKAAEGVESIGNNVSAGIHKAILSGGEPARKVADVLHGTWLGHPLHPILTDITIGAWSMGILFDGIGAVSDSDDMRRVGDKMVIVGTLSAVPTAIAGIVDYSTIQEDAVRTGTFHAMANIVGVGLYTWSIRERLRGRHSRGAIISTVAFGVTCAAAWLGGKLVYRKKVGVNRSESFDKPKRWKHVLDSDDLPQRKLKRVDVDDKGVLLYRKGKEIYAIGSVCSHASGPLEDGKVVNANCVQCPWHDSVFDLRDGSVVHGPATHPQPAFEAREREGNIEIRLADRTR